MSAREAWVFFHDKQAGVLRKTGDGYEFSYDKNYLVDPSAQALSVNLPLQSEPFLSPLLFPFFEGLLREGWLLDLTSVALQLDKRDKFGLLLHSGENAIGAVSIRPKEPDK